MECSALRVSSLILIVMGVVLHIVGFSTNYWTKTTFFGYTTHWGLWQFCGCLPETCVCVSEEDISFLGSQTGYFAIDGWFRAVQAMESIGLGFMIIASVLYLLAFIRPSQLKSFTASSAGLLIFSGLCIISGVAVYASYEEERLQYSFGLCAAAGPLTFFAAACQIGDICTSIQPQTQPPRRQHPQYEMAHYTSRQHARYPVMYPQEHLVPSDPYSYRYAEYYPQASSIKKSSSLGSYCERY